MAYESTERDVILAARRKAAAAMAQRWAHLRTAARHAANPLRWLRTHPVLSVATVVAVGASVVVIAARRDPPPQLLRGRALAWLRKPSAEWLERLGRAVLSTLRRSITSAIVARLANDAGGSGVPTNGHVPNLRTRV